eukprot:CAMPEP_0115435294 /NCGR_PEP_ID=MMETSP0271-20121206/33591_1 /TAXON_ID=71861 /ORGANISM="Scrippsiella trochoidea, Strain CCMP3099" /LENGTH=340 /DNA_ID=CAMNT_0002860759 /DNA_START=55 /DNA_END=1073 /DNA_ORIENTATION=-
MAQGAREGRKLFVGSLPDGIADETLIATFQQYGQIEDVFVKPGCEPGRQSAFVTFATNQQAQYAKESCDRVLTFPGAGRPCEVMIARNQGLFGQGLGKIHVGSLPDSITEWQLRQEFSRFGTVTDVMVKTGCEPGRQWGFVTFQRSAEAQVAKESTDRILMFPGSEKPCEVVMAKNQGMFGQQSATSDEHSAMVQAGDAGPRKIHVGSLPDNISEWQLRHEFSRFGTVTDVMVKTGCEPGRQWGFVTFQRSAEAQVAKESTDRILMFPGSEKPCEVVMAKNQGMFGQQSATSDEHSAMVQAGDAGPRKIHVGSLPDNISEWQLRHEFSRFGTVTDVMVKT